MNKSSIQVRDLSSSDLALTAQLHHEVLNMEFLSRCGLAFLKRYQRAWMESPAGISIVAVDENNKPLGILLGSIDPALHVKNMLASSGIALLLMLIMHAVLHPSFAFELIRTRTVRYIRGALRITTKALSSRLNPQALRQGGVDSQSTQTEDLSDLQTLEMTQIARVGEVTHLLVDPNSQGKGIGRLLTDEAVRRGESAGLSRLVLVTPPDLEARQFYEHLGWIAGEPITSKSGESFVQYHFPLPQHQ